MYIKSIDIDGWFYNIVSSALIHVDGRRLNMSPPKYLGMLIFHAYI